MDNNQIQQLIEKEIPLPSPPKVAMQILNTMQKEEAALSELVRIISTDPALTGKMLRIANSGFYSLKNKVTSINRALSVLGTNIIKNIALSFVIVTDLRGEKQSGFNFDDYWRRSVTSAVAAKLLMQLLEQKDEDIFVAALLHDIEISLVSRFLQHGSDAVWKELLLSLEKRKSLSQSVWEEQHFLQDD